MPSGLRRVREQPAYRLKVTARDKSSMPIDIWSIWDGSRENDVQSALRNWRNCWLRDLLVLSLNSRTINFERFEIKKIILLWLAGYKMIITNSALRASLVYPSPHIKRILVNQCNVVMYCNQSPWGNSNAFSSKHSKAGRAFVESSSLLFLK